MVALTADLTEVCDGDVMFVFWALWTSVCRTTSIEEVNSEQIQQFLARMRAKMKPSQQELGPAIPARRDADLTDDGQIQGNWIDSSHRDAHPILQEPRLRDLIKLDPMTRVNPDKDVQPTGQFEIYNASETMSAIYSLEGAFLGSMRKRRFFHLAGQLLLPPRTFGCPNAEDPAMGPCMRQHPD